MKPDARDTGILMSVLHDLSEMIWKGAVAVSLAMFLGCLALYQGAKWLLQVSRILIFGVCSNDKNFVG